MHVAFAIALLVAAPDRPKPTPKEAPKTFQQQLLGDWKVDRIEMGNGGKMPSGDDGERSLFFTPTEVQVRLKGEPQPMDGATYTIDDTKNPITIDLSPKNELSRKVAGILKIEGEQLIICFSVDGLRPASFAAADNKLTMTMTLKRIKR